MSEAIFGIIGVIVGALLTTGSEFLLRRRDERAQFIVALRLLEAEFLLAGSVLQQALEDGYWAAGSETAVPSWSDRSAALAPRIRRDDWHIIALGVAATEYAPKHFAHQLADGAVTVPLSDLDWTAVSNLLDSVQLAMSVIAEYSGDWPEETRAEPPELDRSAFPPRPPKPSERS